jgi:hypothetical protein
MATYMGGPYLSFPKGAKRSATFQELNGACAAAQALLGDGYVLQLEAISEGGIRFVDWPGKQAYGYKSVRFLSLAARTSNGKTTKSWPWLRDGEVAGTAEYVASVAASTFGPDDINKFYTVLKAFYGAPVFTTTEIQAVMSSLASCYEGSKIRKMPSTRTLQRNFKTHDHPDLTTPRVF